MDVPLAAIHVPARDVEQRNRARNIEIAAAAALDPVIAGAVEEQRHPSGFQIESDERPHIGATELQHEARLRFNEMRILVALANVCRGDAVPAYGFGDVVEIRGARDDPELSVRGRSDERKGG